MITAPPTKSMIDNWRKLFDRFASSMFSNRRTGAEVDAYFRSKYQYRILKSERLQSVVQLNITQNECFREKMPRDAEPEIRCYSVGDVVVGIDLLSGYFQVESEDAGKMASIYDDLFVYRGLDSADLRNFVLVGQYLELTKKNMCMIFSSISPGLPEGG